MVQRFWTSTRRDSIPRYPLPTFRLRTNNISLYSRLHSFTPSLMPFTLHAELHTQMIPNAPLRTGIGHHAAVHDLAQLQHGIAIRYRERELYMLFDQ